MLAAPRDDIHLWLSYYDQIADPLLHAAYLRLLSVEEREQQARFYFAQDRLRYLVTRALVRTVLSRYIPIAPEAWTFVTNEYGRPRIGNALDAAHDLRFNVSHTHSLVVLAVTSGREIGVDVENIGVRKVSIDIADRFFAPDETSALAAVPVERQQDRFFEYWTLKESYIKARGKGLSIPLDKFSFSFPSERGVVLDIHRDLADEPQRWCFWHFRPTPEYLVAICGERVPPARPAVLVRAVVPGVSEQTLTPSFLRTSE